jgi:DNA mismatch endonuclease (patch repair protein)
VADIVSAAERSRIMGRIGGRNTGPEIAVREFLFDRGFRYRLHARDLPGRPDIVLPKWRAAVFVHGCFWHQHPNCRDAVMPSSHRSFWRSKLNANRRRDQAAIKLLQDEGWRVAVLWECVVRHPERHPGAMARLARWLTGNRRVIEIP